MQTISFSRIFLIYDRKTTSLLATHGMVTPKKEFFEAAFGKNQEEFERLLMMPEKYIINRVKHSNNGALDWSKKVRELSSIEKKKLIRCISKNHIPNDILNDVNNSKIRHILEHYL